MQANVNRMRNAFNEWLITHELLGDAQFYPIEEWRARGKDYHDDALLVLTIDGSSTQMAL